MKFFFTKQNIQMNLSGKEKKLIASIFSSFYYFHFLISDRFHTTWKEGLLSVIYPSEESKNFQPVTNTKVRTFLATGSKDSLGNPSLFNTSTIPNYVKIALPNRKIVPLANRRVNGLVIVIPGQDNY